MLTTTANSSGSGGNSTLFSSTSGFAAANVLDTFTLDAGGSVALKLFQRTFQEQQPCKTLPAPLNSDYTYDNLSNVGSRMQYVKADSTDGLNDIAVSGSVHPRLNQAASY